MSRKTNGRVWLLGRLCRDTKGVPGKSPWLKVGKKRLNMVLSEMRLKYSSTWAKNGPLIDTHRPRHKMDLSLFPTTLIFSTIRKCRSYQRIGSVGESEISEVPELSENRKYRKCRTYRKYRKCRNYRRIGFARIIGNIIGFIGFTGISRILDNGLAQGMVK